MYNILLSKERERETLLFVWELHHSVVDAGGGAGLDSECPCGLWELRPNSAQIFQSGSLWYDRVQNQQARGQTVCEYTLLIPVTTPSFNVVYQYLSWSFLSGILFYKALKFHKRETLLHDPFWTLYICNFMINIKKCIKITTCPITYVHVVPYIESQDYGNTDTDCHLAKKKPL